MTSTKNICRLCLEVVSNEYETLDSCKEGMLKIISVNLDVALTNKPLICCKCQEILQHAFFFKTSCLSNEDYLKTFLHCDSNIKLKLEEIVQRDILESKIKSEDESVCRFCLRYFDSAMFVKLNDVDEDIFLRDMLDKCLPEIKLRITNEPLLCFGCMENLQNQFNFVITCLDNDEKIKSYILMNGIDRKVQIDLSEVLKFVDDMKNSEKTVEIDTHFIKLENVMDDLTVNLGLDTNTNEFIDDVFEVKVEETHASDTESDTFDESLRTLDSESQSHRGASPCTECSRKTNHKGGPRHPCTKHQKSSKKKLHKCDQCSFTTVWGSSLNKHVLTHGDPSKVGKFKCAKCPYESKYKKHLLRHCRKHMNVDPKPYKCEYCPWKTGEKWYFKVHYKTKHGKEAPPWKKACQYCDFETAVESELNRHLERVHDKSKHVCHCGYTSHRLYHFQQHSLRHLDEKEVETFDCDICDFKSRYKNSYKTHMTLHKEGKMPRRVKRVVRKWRGQKIDKVGEK